MGVGGVGVPDGDGCVVAAVAGAASRAARCCCMAILMASWSAVLSESPVLAAWKCRRENLHGLIRPFAEKFGE